MQQMISLLQILLLARHVSGTIMPIIRSSRVLYRWLLPLVREEYDVPGSEFSSPNIINFDIRQTARSDLFIGLRYPRP